MSDPARREKASGASRVLLAVATGVLCVGLAELALRVLEQVSYRDSLARAFAAPELPAEGVEAPMGELLRPSPHELVVYELKPELDVHFMDATVRTNGQGWREGDLLTPKPERVRRVLGLGDSVAFGWGVAEEERYLDRLEAKLNERFPDERWETVALAVPGYNLVMEVAALRAYGLDYEPDLILYGFVQNDDCLPNFVHPRPRFLSSRLRLADLVSRASVRQKRLVNRGDVVGDGFRDSDFASRFCNPDAVDAVYQPLVGRENFAAALEELRDLGAEHDIPVVIIAHSWVGGFSFVPKIEGLIYVDPAEHFARVLAAEGVDHPRKSSLVLSYEDPHPSASAHEITAEVLFERLADDGVWARVRARNRAGGD